MNEREAIRQWMRENPERAAQLQQLYDCGLLHGMEVLASDVPTEECSSSEYQEG